MINFCLGSMAEMLRENCTSEYKYAEHFHGLKELSNSISVKVIRVFSSAGMEKGNEAMQVELQKPPDMRYLHRKCK